MATVFAAVAAAAVLFPVWNADRKARQQALALATLRDVTANAGWNGVPLALAVDLFDAATGRK